MVYVIASNLSSTRIAKVEYFDSKRYAECLLYALGLL